MTRRRGRHDIPGGPGRAPFHMTPAMRGYLAAFDRFLAVPSHANREHREAAFERFRDDQTRKVA